MLKFVFRCMLLLMLSGVMLAPRAQAQAAIYGEFSGEELTNLVGTNYAFGATTGVLVDVSTLHRIVVTADIQGRFMNDSVEKLDGVVLGPRFELPIKRGKLTPYGEFMIGFLRYNKASMQISTTDSTFQINGGVAKQMSPHWDAVLEYSYAQYFALGGAYNPKTFSVGAIYHFTKR